MSSPTSSLKKEKKLPFDVARRPPPFRRNYHKTGEDGQDVCDLLIARNKEHTKTSHLTSATGITDMELMSSMMSKLAQTEKKLKEAESVIRQKDTEIMNLTEKCSILERSKGNGGGKSTQLEEKCSHLQSQVRSMERFLEDYGMIWVGTERDDDNDEELELSNESTTKGWNQRESWNPAASTNAFSVNFDLILKNIDELNKIAAEDQLYIGKSKDRAQFCKRDPINLTLYSNGIFMFEGPFRSYSEPETRLCIQDLADGYFPSELQNHYPNGVLFNVTDKRNVNYHDKRHNRLFPGSGKCLTAEQQSNEPEFESIQRVDREPSQPPVPHQKTADQLLQKLPTAVIKQGVIVDVRSDLSRALKGTNTPSNTIIVETDVVKEMRLRMTKDPEIRPPTPGNITTLRIRSEQGNQIYLLKMKHDDTIEKVHSYLENVRSNKTQDYVLKTSFPSRTYINPDATLMDCGLVPNAVLMICPVKQTSTENSPHK